MTRSMWTVLIVASVAAWGCRGQERTDGIPDPGDAAAVGQAQEDGQPAATAEHESSPAARALDSPQATFDAMQAAAAAKDVRALFSMVTDESQEMIATQTVLMAGFVIAMEDLFGEMSAEFGEAFEGGAGGADTRELREILKRHGLELDDEGEFSAETLAGINDRPGFIADVWGWMEQHGESAADFRMVQGTLENVQVQGDTATGEIVIPGSGERQEVEFRRVGSRWLAHFGDFAGQPEAFSFPALDDDGSTFESDFEFPGR